MNIDGNIIGSFPSSSSSGFTLTTASYPSEPFHKIRIRPVENGFSVLCSGKEYVFNQLEQLLKFIKSELSEP